VSNAHSPACHPAVNGGSRREMQLFAALGTALSFTKVRVSRFVRLDRCSFCDCRQLDDTEYRLRALFFAALGLIASGTWSTGSRWALAQRVSNLPSGPDRPGHLLVGERMLGTTLYFLGDLGNARRHLEHMLSNYPAPIRWSHILRFQLDVPAERASRSRADPLAAGISGPRPCARRRTMSRTLAPSIMCWRCVPRWALRPRLQSLSAI